MSIFHCTNYMLNFKYDYVLLISKLMLCVNTVFGDGCNEHASPDSEEQHVWVKIHPITSWLEG